MKTADAKTREQLKQLREQLASARAERTQFDKDVDEAKAAASDLDLSATDLREKPEFLALQEAIRERGQTADRIADLELFEANLLAGLGERATPNGDTNRNGTAAAADHRAWDGQTLLRESDGYQAAREAGLFTSRNRFGTIQIGELADRETMVQFLNRPAAGPLPGATPGNVASTVSYIQPDFRGIIPPLLKPLSLLDLLPTGTTDSNVVEYVQVTALPLSAAETAEGTLKPEAGITMQDATAPVRTIPQWIKANRQALDDVAGLATLLNTLLPYGVRRRLEAQILAGDGTGQNLKGIMNTTGVGAPAHVAGDNAADSILRAVTVIVLSDADPNFVTLNPTDWQNLLLIRAGASDGSWRGQYLYGSPGELQAPTIWGLLITKNRIMPTNSALVGDAMGATLLVREGLNVRTSDSDQDDFVNNRVTILAESRAAFPVWRPSSFAVATLS